MKVVSEYTSKKIEKSLPCIVKEISGDRKTVTVQPLIKIIDRNGESTERQSYISIPVVNMGAGDILISFPIVVGDLGWIDASDRDISLFLQSYSAESPGSRRMHSFSDARFIPDIMTNFSIDSEDSEALVIQNRAGTVKIAMDDEIRIVNNSVNVTVDGSSVSGTAPGGFNFNGATIDADGNITTAAGVSLDGHGHDVENVETGTSTITTTAPN